MGQSYAKLNAENAYIWRIVHRSNLPWILKNGLHCRSSQRQSPNYVTIGNEELMDKRSRRSVPLPPGGTLSDYVPFYFTPFSPMMYNIYTGRGVIKRRNEEIIILVSSLHRVKELGHSFLFTDRHAYPPHAVYYGDIRKLSELDWPLLQARDFTRNPDDPLQFERYQAEALIYQHLPLNALLGIVCYSEKVKSNIEHELEAYGTALDVRARQGWYFT